MPEIKDIVLLSNNVQYVVANKVRFNNRNFYMFIDAALRGDIKICGERQIDGKAIYKEVKNNDKLLLQLLKLFNDNKVD